MVPGWAAAEGRGVGLASVAGGEGTVPGENRGPRPAGGVRRPWGAVSAPVGPSRCCRGRAAGPGGAAAALWGGRAVAAAVMWHRALLTPRTGLCGGCRLPYVTLRPGRGQCYRNTGLSPARCGAATRWGLVFVGVCLKEPLALLQFIGHRQSRSALLVSWCLQCPCSSPCGVSCKTYAAQTELVLV